MKPTKLFLSCEHAVNTIPSSYSHLFQGQDEVLKTHRGWDIGAKAIALYLKENLNCELVEASVSRLLIDCNRSVTHPHCFSEFTKLLKPVEKQQLIADYYLPYRQQVETFIKHYIEIGFQVLHVSVHSFTPIFQGKTRNASIGLLYDPKRHGEKEVSRQWCGLICAETNYRVRLNYPYAGSSDGLTTYLRRCHTEKDYLGIELEVNQTLSGDKSSLDKIAKALANSLVELLQLL
jgi:predicted N-formylglutamate amidohydrolase